MEWRICTSRAMALLHACFLPVQLSESMERLPRYTDDISCFKIVVLQATKRQGAILMTLFRDLQNVDFNAVRQCVGDEAMAVRPVLHFRQGNRINLEAGVKANHRVQVDPRD